MDELAPHSTAVRPLRKWYLEEISELLDACVILHNMTVEERQGKLLEGEQEEDFSNQKFPLFGYNAVTQGEANLDNINLWSARVGIFNQRIQSSALHYQLKSDLVQHINETKY